MVLKILVEFMPECPCAPWSTIHSEFTIRQLSKNLLVPISLHFNQTAFGVIRSIRIKQPLVLAAILACLLLAYLSGRSSYVSYCPSYVYYLRLRLREMSPVLKDYCVQRSPPQPIFDFEI